MFGVTKNVLSDMWHMILTWLFDKSMHRDRERRDVFVYAGWYRVNVTCLSDVWCRILTGSFDKGMPRDRERRDISLCVWWVVQSKCYLSF